MILEQTPSWKIQLGLFVARHLPSWMRAMMPWRKTLKLLVRDARTKQMRNKDGTVAYAMLQLWVANGTSDDAEQVRATLHWKRKGGGVLNQHDTPGLWLKKIGTEMAGYRDVDERMDLPSNGEEQHLGLVAKAPGSHDAFIVAPSVNRREAVHFSSCSPTSFEGGSRPPVTYVLLLATCVGLLSCGEVAASSRRVAQSAVEWDRADAATVRLDPSGLRDVPEAVRVALSRRNCTIPQPSGATAVRNVIVGRFTTSSRNDWAALCSRGRASAILVFPGGAAGGVMELGSEPDRRYLQVIGADGAIGYSRMLRIATPQRIRRALKSEPVGSRSVEHDGIEDSFEGKSSALWYWRGDQWIQLAGAD